LLEKWKGTKGITRLHVDWKSVPKSGGKVPLKSYVDLAVEIEAADSKGLQRLYAKLTRELSKEPFCLSSRSCTLNDMFA